MILTENTGLIPQSLVCRLWRHVASALNRRSQHHCLSQESVKWGKTFFVHLEVSKSEKVIPTGGPLRQETGDFL